MAVRIVTDTASDFTVEQAQQANLTLVPMPITHEGKTYRDAYDLSKSDFYHLLTSSDSLPKTAQPAPQDFLMHFLDAKQHGDSVVCIVLSSALSGTLQSAMLAKTEAEYDEIYIVDSKCCTGAMMILVHEALRLRQEGASAPEIAAQLEALRPRVGLYAVLDTLEYLYKGGRLTRLQAGAGTLMSVKPIVTLDENGAVVVCGKSIGRKKAFDHLLALVRKVDMDPSYEPLFLYSALPQACEPLMDALEIPQQIRQTRMLEVGATIGTHVGPGVFGMVFVRRA